jgi:hypothetical protein
MITTQSGMVLCGCRSVGECTHNAFAEQRALDMLVEAFAREMKRKLRRKLIDGRHGWDDPACADGIREELLNHIKRGAGQEIDVANMAAILWNFSHGT